MFSSIRGWFVICPELTCQEDLAAEEPRIFKIFWVVIFFEADLQQADFVMLWCFYCQHRNKKSLLLKVLWVSVVSGFPHISSSSPYHPKMSDGVWHQAKYFRIVLFFISASVYCIASLQHWKISAVLQLNWRVGNFCVARPHTSIFNHLQNWQGTPRMQPGVGVGEGSNSALSSVQDEVVPPKSNQILL